MSNNKLIIGALLTGALFSSVAIASQPMPANDAIKVEVLESFPLADQVRAMQGYQIRARRIVVKPGGEIGQHSHTDRAGIVFVESGSITEFRGQNSRLLMAGDTLREDATTVHSYKNSSEQDCVLIAVDLPKLD